MIKTFQNEYRKFHDNQIKRKKQREQQDHLIKRPSNKHLLDWVNYDSRFKNLVPKMKFLLIRTINNYQNQQEIEEKVNQLRSGTIHQRALSNEKLK